MTELGPSAKHVLADYASVVGPQYTDAVQNWNELVRRIERDEPEMPLPVVTPLRGRTRAIVALSFAAAAAIAALWVGGRATVAALATDDRPSAASWQGGSLVGEHEPAAVVDQVVVVDDDERRRDRPRAAELVETPTVVAPIAPPPPPPVVTPRTKPARPQASRTDAAPTDAGATTDAASTLEQVGMIRKAYAALRAGDPGQALRVLDGHAKRWPTSEFAGERDLLRVKALCAAGRKSEAESAAATFKRKHPGSPLRAALEQCTDDEPTP
jgi:hypothetical protein